MHSVVYPDPDRRSFSELRNRRLVGFGRHLASISAVDISGAAGFGEASPAFDFAISTRPDGRRGIRAFSA